MNIEISILNLIFGWFINCPKRLSRHSVITLSKLFVIVEGIHMLLRTCKNRQKSLSVGLRLHKLMRYNSPILARPEYFLVACSYSRDKWKWMEVRRSTWPCVFGMGKCGHAADVLDREHTASAVENWKPHEKTQQLFLHLHSKQKVSAGQYSDPPGKGIPSLQRPLYFSSQNWFI